MNGTTSNWHEVYTKDGEHLLRLNIETVQAYRYANRDNNPNGRFSQLYVYLAGGHKLTLTGNAADALEGPLFHFTTGRARP